MSNKRRVRIEIRRRKIRKKRGLALRKKKREEHSSRHTENKTLATQAANATCNDITIHCIQPRK